MLSVSCADTRPELIPAPVIPIPPQLTADCEQADMPDDLTFGGAVELLADAMKYIANCNHDKQAIREIEAGRIKNSPAIAGQMINRRDTYDSCNRIYLLKVKRNINKYNYLV
ncbi:Rz1-like lysis system protein LysC [Morganella morganii]|uniref:Rz1-like lysis system protein LysC n=2 Tax=Morganella morganii TaxID=582 RepID=UPI003EB91759